MRKKIYMTIVLTLVLVFSTFSSVSAYTQYVGLSISETEDHTTPHFATKAKVKHSYNSSSSERGVYCYLIYLGPVNNYYHVSRILDPGETYGSGFYTSGGILEGAFQIQLNPVGWGTSGCTANATIETN